MVAKYGNRKRTNYKKYIRMGGRSAMAIAKTAYKGVRMLKGLVNAERHYIDSYGAISPDHTGSVIPLTHVAQGDTNVTRTGMSVLVRGIYLQFEAVMNVNLDNCGLRVVLFQFKDNATQPVASDLLEYTGSGFAILSPLKRFNTRSFKVLGNWRFNMSNTGKNSVLFKKYIKLYTHCRYDGPNSADYANNQIYCLFITDTDNGSSRGDPNVDYMIRTGFYDN